MNNQSKRLSTEDYEKLRKEVLQRDGWRCQQCGSMQNLEVHHQRFRSHQGNDIPLNLITLCHVCHAIAHQRGKVVTQIAA